MYIATLYVLALGTQHYNYLPTYVHSYIRDMYTHVVGYPPCYCTMYSYLYCYNYLSSCYLYVRLSVTDNSFTLFPLMLAGLVYQHSVRNRIIIEANFQFSQFVSQTIIIDNKLL